MENVLNIQKTHSDTSGDSDEPHITQADLGVICDYMQTELPVYEFQVLSPHHPRPRRLPNTETAARYGRWPLGHDAKKRAPCYTPLVC